MTNCYHIADYFISLAHETGSLITNLKLQKLVYYAQAWYLALYGIPLFEEDFQAWIHGPVIPELYDKYKSNKWRPIEEETKPPNLSVEVEEFLKEVVEAYFDRDAYELELMTHLEEPWINARGDISIDTPSNQVISKESMKIYYQSRVQEQE